jgi:hypothetical protein
MATFLKLLLLVTIGQGVLRFLFPGRTAEGRPSSRLAGLIVHGIIVLGVLSLNAWLAPGNLTELRAIGVGDARDSPMQVPTGQSFREQAPAPEFFVSYPTPSNPALGAWMVYARERQILENYSRWANSWVKLNTPVAMTYHECGQVNAMYDPRSKTIIMCLEQLSYLGEHYRYRLPAEQVPEAIEGAAAFILSHELGHALVDVLDLPVTGREEDAVDQLAAYVLLGSGNGRHALVSWMNSLRQEGDVFAAMSDEHSLTGQRQFNLMCWMYGADPGRNADLVAYGHLPLPRAQRCPAEYQQLRRSWDRILAPHLR